MLATGWEEFRELDFEKVASLMAERHIVDARNLLDPDELEALGFTYSGVGRG